MEFGQAGGYAKLGYEISQAWNVRADVNLTHFNASNPGKVTDPLIDNDQRITRGMTSFALENNYEKTSGALSFFYNWGKHWINDGYAVGGEPLDYRFNSRDDMLGLSWYQSVQLFKGNRLTAGVDFFHFGGESWNQPVNGGERQPQVDKKQDEMAGYVDYDGAYLYFDRTGTAVLRTKKIIEGVPHIEGLMFDSAKAKIGKKLPVEDDSIFEKIVEVSKNLKKYNLTPDRMGCTDGGVQIYFEIVQVSLGNGNYEEKLRQVEPILKKLTELYPGKAGVLHLENYDAESESITFVPAA